MSSPLYSICVPVFNGGKTIGPTIQSVLDQTLDDFELVVLDNQSDDHTVDVVKGFSDDRIRIICQKERVPVAQNWSDCVRLAKGKWVKLLCADDILNSRALEVEQEFLGKCPNARVSAGIRTVISPNGTEYPLRNRRPRDEEPCLIDISTLGRLVCKSGSNPLGESVCLTWRADVTDGVGLFDGSWDYFIDLDYWLRLTAKHRVLLIPEVLGSFRVSRASWTGSLGLGTVHSAKKFFTQHPLIRGHKGKVVGFFFAVLRSVAREVVISFVIARDRRERQKSN